ncbi:MULTISPECIES: TRAP transporter small permease subunit [Achromobacter]|jgi:TRAP-type mannitol/chloroaromatic compound transport system permease small subunit|uniref:TRAP transporter small permease subunit n=1 Tax=Achromobacter TaxID=222 RepID=UPI000FC2F07A|nr:TRAP transporter small permease subunit [Achromobacter sp. JUb104]MCS3505320.1 TRAP-type mannitol/chloroaromatic compound transport system permease small subunit [Achromobacter sp. JUb104]
MLRLVRLIDRVSTFVGKTFAWLIVVLTLHVCWEVAARYLLNKPSAWAFDMQMMYYGILFMMAGAYTLAKNGHVRGDILYGFLPPRVQGGLDLILYLVFFFPGVIALVWAGWYYASYSIAIGEHSSLMANGPPIYPFKAFIPIAGAVLLLQGVAEVLRCVLCLRQGAWPSREEDVEEVDIDKLKEMVHVKDEDIAQLDRYVTTPGEPHR